MIAVSCDVMVLHQLALFGDAGSRRCSKWHCRWTNFNAASAADASCMSRLQLVVCASVVGATSWRYRCGWLSIVSACAQLDDTWKCIALYEVCWCKLRLAVFSVSEPFVWAVHSLLQLQVRVFVCFKSFPHLCLLFKFSVRFAGEGVFEKFNPFAGWGWPHHWWSEIFVERVGFSDVLVPYVYTCFWAIKCPISSGRLGPG